MSTLLTDEIKLVEDGLHKPGEIGEGLGTC